MKKLLFLILLGIGVTGCSVEEQMNMDVQEKNFEVEIGQESEKCGDATIHYYVNRFETELGNVEVTNDAATLYVKITSNVAGALMNGNFAWAETFEDFGSTPGTLPPGKMDEKMDEHGVTTFTWTVDLDDINTDCILIAARAIFKANAGTHWAGDQTAGMAEWKYFSYCIQPCEPPQPPVIICESAYAYSADPKETLIAKYGGKPSAQNWGWFNYVDIDQLGQYETLLIYAAAGQNDITKGTLVGTANVYYNGTVTFHPLPQFTFYNTHVFKGEDMPTKRLPPGHFERNSTAVSGGDFYVIIHLEVCGASIYW